MNNAQQVSQGRPHQIHMGTSTEDSDAVMKNVDYRGWSPRWLEQRLNIISCWSASNQLHRLGLTRRKLKKLVCGHSLTFYWILHVAYYGALTVAGTISLWWCRGKEKISLVDCIFNAVSALTNTGLSSALIRDFTPLGVFVLMVLMFLGHAVFVSLLPVYVRRFQFFRHDRALIASDTVVKLGDLPHRTSYTADVHYVTFVKKKASSTNGESMDISRTDQNLEVLKRGDEQGHGDIDDFGISPDIESEILRGKVANCCGKSCKDRVTPQSDHDTGLLEHQALITLSWLVPIYMIVFLTFGFVSILCYTSFSSKGSSTVRALYKAEEVNPIFTAIFLSISVFSNTGLSPLDDNMVPFAASPLVLVPLAALILAGNCMFPPTLRFIIWGLSILKRTDDPQRNVYKYLLQFPRRCYTHLFPQVHTTWLVATVVAFNIVDLVAFCALEWNSVPVTEDLSDSSAGVKLMDGLFQSLNTRSAGMNILQLSSLSPPLLVLYTAMMGIAAYPVFLSRQHSRLTRTDINLHQYYDTCVPEKIAPTDAADKKMSLQFRNLFTRDSASIFVHIFLICTVEIRSINSDPLNYTIFSIVFEVISAYGNVGLSLGYSCKRWAQARANTPRAQAAAACKDIPYSFSGKWRAGSKLMLVGAMLMGRHRSLPDDMDAAIAMAPSCLCSKSSGRTLNCTCSEC